MHKKSRKHSGVVLVYSLLKKKKTGAACPSISSLFPLFGEVGGGGGWGGEPFPNTSPCSQSVSLVTNLDTGDEGCLVLTQNPLNLPLDNY